MRLKVFFFTLTRICSHRVHQPWYNTNIHEARRIHRKHEKKWRKTGLEVHHELYLTQNNLVNTMIEDSKKAFLREKKIKDVDSKSAFRTVKGLLNKNDKILPAHDSLQCLCIDFALYFKENVDNIQCGLENDRQNVVCSEVVNVCGQSNVIHVNCLNSNC